MSTMKDSYLRMGVSGRLMFAIVACTSMTITLGSGGRLLHQVTAPPGGSCGPSANAVCPSPQCCSQWNFCGITEGHCGTGCQRAWGSCSGAPSPPSTPQPPPGGSAAGVTEGEFSCVFLNNRDVQGKVNTEAVVRKHFNFFTSASAALGFNLANKLEACIFLGNIRHEYGGYLDNMVENCFRTTNNPAACPAYDTCSQGGNNYFGRGPLQLSHCFNYNAMSQYVGVDLKQRPGAVANPSSDLAWKTAMAFWTKGDFNCQGSWVGAFPTCPSAARAGDIASVTRRINGALECVSPRPQTQSSRVNTVIDVCSRCFQQSSFSNLYCS